MDDVIYKGMNITAMHDNFVKLKNIVKAQGEIIQVQKKNLVICVDKIAYLERELSKKQDDYGRMGGNMFKDIMKNRK